MGNFIYTDTVCGVCDKYEVWVVVGQNKLVLGIKWYWVDMGL